MDIDYNNREGRWYIPVVQVNADLHLAQVIQKSEKRLYDNLNIQRAKEGLELINLEHNCFTNATTALKLFDGILFEYSYVEGYIIFSHNLTVQPHGWLQRDGESGECIILDPTLVKDGTVMNQPVIHYFPGLIFSLKDIKRKDFGYNINGKPTLPYYKNYGPDGTQNHSMRWAFKAAQAYRREALK